MGTGYVHMITVIGPLNSAVPDPELRTVLVGCEAVRSLIADLQHPSVRQHPTRRAVLRLQRYPWSLVEDDIVFSFVPNAATFTVQAFRSREDDDSEETPLDLGPTTRDANLSLPG